MAQRRMFTKKVTDTDVFLDMPLSTQALYFHLNMHADDDGFVDNINTIKRMVGASKDDEKLLIAKQFLIPFEDSGVVVIKDWRMHNYIRKDTYNKTIHLNELEQLSVNTNGSYEPKLDTSTKRPRIVHDSSPQVRLGKDRLGKSKNSTTPSNEVDVVETQAELVVSPMEVTKLIVNKMNQLMGNTGNKMLKATPTKAKIVGTRLKDYTPDELLAMIEFKWHFWADWSGRTNAFSFDTLMRPSNVDKYMDEMNTGKKFVPFNNSQNKRSVVREHRPDWENQTVQKVSAEEKAAAAAMMEELSGEQE